MERHIVEEYIQAVHSWLIIRPNGEAVLRLSEHTPKKHAGQRALTRLIVERMPQYDVTLRGRLNRQTTITLKDYKRSQKYVASFTRLDIERSRED